jgi:DNA-binding MarR family transcriptional regulator
LGQAALSQDQVFKLLQIVEGIACHRGLTTDEAIGFLEDAAAGALQKPSYRSITQFAAGLRAIRVRRNETLGLGVFRDPAWDMLLDLLVAQDEGRRVSVSGLCYASGVPTTTALRHVERLETLGMVSREGDPSDRRRYWVEPETDTLERVRDIVARIQSAA